MSPPFHLLEVSLPQVTWPFKAFQRWERASTTQIG